VRFDHNRYSVAVKAARSHRASCAPMPIGLSSGMAARLSASTPAASAAGQTAYDPCITCRVVGQEARGAAQRRPVSQLGPAAGTGANPASVGRPWRRRRQFVDILTAVAEGRLDAVEEACAEALAAKLFGRDVVLNILARQRDVDPPRPVATPAALALAIEPAADCARYDQLRKPAGRGSLPPGSLAWSGMRSSR